MVDPGVDPNTGLIYLRARYYDPTTGQFLSVDPLVAETGQPYSYANDDPINETDPTGLWGGFLDLGCVGDAIGSGATWAYGHPVETLGLVAGGVSLATGVGEVAVGAGLFGEAASESLAGTVLSGVSFSSGVAATGIDTRYCLGGGSGSSASCVGAGVGLATVGAGGLAFWGEDAEAEAVAEEEAGAAANAKGIRAGAMAIGLTLGGIALLGDTASAANGAVLDGVCRDGAA